MIVTKTKYSVSLTVHKFRNFEFGEQFSYIDIELTQSRLVTYNFIQRVESPVKLVNSQLKIDYEI